MSACLPAGLLACVCMHPLHCTDSSLGAFPMPLAVLFMFARLEHRLDTPRSTDAHCAHHHPEDRLQQIDGGVAFKNACRASDRDRKVGLASWGSWEQGVRGSLQACTAARDFGGEFWEVMQPPKTESGRMSWLRSLRASCSGSFLPHQLESNVG